MKIIPLLFILFTAYNCYSATWVEHPEAVSEPETKTLYYNQAKFGGFISRESTTPHHYNQNLVPDSDHTGVDLSYSIFHDADLTGIDFTNSDLSNSYLHAYYDNANFSYANLRNADLGGGLSVASYAIFDYADLRGAAVMGMSASFIGADLRGAYRGDDGFAYADFSYADMRGVNLEHFFDSHFLYSITFTGTYLHNAILPSGYDQAYFESSGANFSPVPEPSTYALILGALALGFAIRRRK